MKKLSWPSKRLCDGRCSPGKEFLCADSGVLQLGWELSPRATTELRDAMILHLGHHGGQGLCWGAPGCSSLRAEPISQQQPQPRMGEQRLRPYLRGSTGKRRRSWHYIQELQGANPNPPTSKLRLLKDRGKRKQKREKKLQGLLGCWFIRALKGPSAEPCPKPPPAPAGAYQWDKQPQLSPGCRCWAGAGCRMLLLKALLPHFPCLAQEQ